MTHVKISRLKSLVHNSSKLVSYLAHLLPWNKNGWASYQQPIIFIDNILLYTVYNISYSIQDNKVILHWKFIVWNQNLTLLYQASSALHMPSRVLKYFLKPKQQRRATIANRTAATLLLKPASLIHHCLPLFLLCCTKKRSENRPAVSLLSSITIKSGLT